MRVRVWVRRVRVRVRKVRVRVRKVRVRVRRVRVRVRVRKVRVRKGRRLPASPHTLPRHRCPAPWRRPGPAGGAASSPAGS